MLLSEFNCKQTKPDDLTVKIHKAALWKKKNHSAAHFALELYVVYSLFFNEVKPLTKKTASRKPVWSKTDDSIQMLQVQMCRSCKPGWCADTWVWRCVKIWTALLFSTGFQSVKCLHLNSSSGLSLSLGVSLSPLSLLHTHAHAHTQSATIPQDASYKNLPCCCRAAELQQDPSYKLFNSNVRVAKTSGCARIDASLPWALPPSRPPSRGFGSLA